MYLVKIERVDTCYLKVQQVNLKKRGHPHDFSSIPLCQPILRPTKNFTIIFTLE